MSSTGATKSSSGACGKQAAISACPISCLSMRIVASGGSRSSEVGRSSCPMTEITGPIGSDSSRAAL